MAQLSLPSPNTLIIENFTHSLLSNLIIVPVHASITAREKNRGSFKKSFKPNHSSLTSCYQNAVYVIFHLKKKKIFSSLGFKSLFLYLATTPAKICSNKVFASLNE